jgi:WD40 repeat protein
LAAVRIALVGTTADFWGFGPRPSLPINHLLCENRRTAGRIGEDRLKEDQGVISALAFSKDAHFLAAASWNGTITIWDLSSGSLLHRLEGNTKAVVAVQFSPEGQELYARSVDGAIREWRIPDGELVRIFEAPQ